MFQADDGVRFTPPEDQIEEKVIPLNEVRTLPIISSTDYEVDGKTYQDLILAKICLAANLGYCSICTLVHCSHNPDCVKKT